MLKKKRKEKENLFNQKNEFILTHAEYVLWVVFSGIEKKDESEKDVLEE